MNTRSPADIYRMIAERGQAGGPCALALVLAAHGSTPCKAGAKAAFFPDGAMIGTIGGGAVEARAARTALEAIRAAQPVLFDFDLQGEEPGGVRPICGGTMRVLVDPAAADHREAYAAAAGAANRRQRGVLLTAVETSPAIRVSAEFVAEDRIGHVAGFPGAEALRAVLQKDQAALFFEEAAARRREILVEPLVPKPLLLIAGAGHVGRAVAWQADLVGFEVVVLDDRSEFLCLDRFPEGTVFRAGPMDESIRSFPPADDTYIVIVTRGHAMDAQVLAACLDRPAAYVGMIGSRRKVAQMRRDFIESGRATASAFDRVHAPIGLDIGAATVPEIAASIVAQLIAVRRGGRAARQHAE